MPGLTKLVSPNRPTVSYIGVLGSYIGFGGSYIGYLGSEGLVEEGKKRNAFEEFSEGQIASALLLVVHQVR